MEKVEKIILSENWTLMHKEKDLNIPTEVPGSVFETLIDNEIIENPFYGSNEHKMNCLKQESKKGINILHYN